MFYLYLFHRSGVVDPTFGILLLSGMIAAVFLLSLVHPPERKQNVVSRSKRSSVIDSVSPEKTRSSRIT